MSFMDVMGGFGQNNFQNNLAQNSAMNQANQAAIQQQQAMAAAQQAQLNNLYGPQGFGGQTAQYAAAGAAAGRATGYYGDTFAGLTPGQTTPAAQAGWGAPTPAQPSSPEEAAYFAAYPDVAKSGMTASQHYKQYGQAEGRDSFGMVFNTGANEIPYLYSGSLYGATGDVGQSPGMAPGYGGFNNPAVPTSPQQWYANGGYNPYDPNTYAGVAGIPGGNPQMLGTGSGGYNPQWGGSSIYPKGPQATPSDWNNWFGQFQSTTGGGPNDYSTGNWEKEYLLGNQDVFNAAKASGQDPIAFADQHFRDYGQAEGRRAFDANEYLRENPDVAAAGVNPLQHYNQYGREEGRAEPMSSAFDPMQYKLLNQDVADAGVDPTAHWFQYGQKEGRAGGFTMNEPDTPSWQTAIAKQYRDPSAFEAMNNMAFAKIDPSALGALFSEESGWNPRNTTGSQYGLAQMAKEDFNYGGAGGALGGLTFDQYRNASAADQIGAYADLLARIQQRNPGLDFSTMTPQRQYAVLQALNFGPYTGEPGTIDWITAMNQGNTSMPTTNKSQAKDLGDRSINAIEQAYLKKQALLPTR